MKYLISFRLEWLQTNGEPMKREWENGRALVNWGRFHVSRRRRELRIDGKPIAVNTRGFDILTALIDAGGTLVTKDELLRRIWPNTVVEENTLQSHVHALRRALGKYRNAILTESGRGYRFVGDISAAVEHALPSEAASAPSHGPLRPANLTSLPVIVSDLIGREQELEELFDIAIAHRLVTLTGAGGIGKTRLGLEVARSLLHHFPDGVWLADLAPLSDPKLVPVTVASALGLELKGTQVFSDRVAARLGAKRLMLVLDNCEHVVEVAACITETLLHAVAEVHVLATSQEPLGAEGEYTYRVPPLGIPPAGVTGAEQALRYGAVQLFVARVQAADPRFLLDDNAAAAVGAICRRLDGIPLALELAAARTPAFGVQRLASRLHDSFRLLTSGRRTALPRHKTLRATFDWSYGLLSSSEQVVLRRLAIFAGGFTLEAAGVIVADEQITTSVAVDRIADLIAKSLVTVSAFGAAARYRLLETTHDYALERLVESGEFEAVARRHADHYRMLFEQAETEWEKTPTREWLVALSPETDNVRTALDWAFAAGGDPSIGVALTTSLVPLWLQLSLLDECRQHVDRALGGVDAISDRRTEQEMRLQAALGLSLMHTKGPVEETAAAWKKALELAESLNHVEYQLRATYGLWLYRTMIGEYRIALALVHMFRICAEDRGDPSELLTCFGMTGIALHYRGDQINARDHLTRLLDCSAPSSHRSLAVRFGFDQRVGALVHLAMILWLQGLPDQAKRVGLASVDEGRTIDHVTSICFALANAACPLGMLMGELTAAEHLIARLIDHAEKHGLGVWRAYGIALSGWVAAERGNRVEGVRLLTAGVDAIRRTRFAQRLTMYLGALAMAMAGAGQVEDGLTTINEALRRSERNGEHWNIAELLRIKGELVLLQNGCGSRVGEDLIVQARRWARQQRAISWELRAALSLGRIWHDEGRDAEARELVASVYNRFTEGFDATDLKSAELFIHQRTPSVPQAFTNVNPGAAGRV